LAINQSDPTGLTIYLGVSNTNNKAIPSNWTGLYKSTDGGSTFRHVLKGVSFVGNGPARHASPSIAIDPSRPWRVWAAPQQGLYLSVDGGESFQPVPSFAPQSGYNASAPVSTMSMAFISLVPPPDASTPSPLATHVVVGMLGNGIAFSGDDGANWVKIVNITALNETGAPTPLTIEQPQRFHRAPNGTTFFSAANGIPPQYPTWRVFFLRVTATNWSDVTTWVYQDITPNGRNVGLFNLVETPNGWGEGSTLLVCSQGFFNSLWESGDSGTTWAMRNITVTSEFPMWWPQWDTNHSYVPFGRNAIVTSSRAPGRWLIASGFGVFKSYDRGNTWAGSSKGIGYVFLRTGRGGA
jgi:hypothetical protein